MKRPLIAAAIVLLLAIAILTGSLVSARSELRKAELSAASVLSIELRELTWGLDALLADTNGERCPYDEPIEMIQSSLGRINGALSAIRPTLDITGCYEFHNMSDCIEGLNFIKGCLSAYYKATWNDDRIEGILVDGVIDENEREYITRLRAELVELRAPLLLPDGLNLNPDVKLEDVIEPFADFLERFYYGAYVDDPAWRLLAR